MEVASKSSAVRVVVFVVVFLTSDVFRSINISFPNSYPYEAAENLAPVASHYLGRLLIRSVFA